MKHARRIIAVALVALATLSAMSSAQAAVHRQAASGGPPPCAMTAPLGSGLVLD
jgi:hypothetical protein